MKCLNCKKYDDCRNGSGLTWPCGAYVPAKVLKFPDAAPSLGDCVLIVEHGLEDDAISIKDKVFAIERVSEMETHNSIRKDDLVKSLRWLFSHYDFDTEDLA